MKITLRALGGRTVEVDVDDGAPVDAVVARAAAEWGHDARAVSLCHHGSRLDAAPGVSLSAAGVADGACVFVVVERTAMLRRSPSSSADASLTASPTASPTRRSSTSTAAA